MKHRKIFLSFLLALAMVVGLLPGMGLRAYAAGGTEVTQANVICQQYSYMDADYYSGGVLNDTPPVEITNITLADAQAFGAAVNCPTTYWVVVYAKDGDNLKWTSNGKTGEQTSNPRSVSGRVLSAWFILLNDDVFFLPDDPMRGLTFYFSKGLATVSVTGVSLDKTTAQTIEVDGKVSFTATVAPDNATDKKVKWSVGGTDAGAVKLYSDEACTTEVGANATDKLTVYAKGISAGSATVTATSNADSEKKASCDVTVNAAEPESTYTLTIPSTLTVANSGWNATGGISATGTLAKGKKLTVTASSANSWALKSGDNSVGYNLATATGTYSNSATPASWEFTELTNTATNKPMGIIVEDYSTKPAGTYQDTVTFTASVGAAAPLYYDKAVQVYRYDNPGPNYRDYLYSGNYKTLSADEGYALAQYFASVNSCSVCVITDWNDSSGQTKYVTNSSSAEQQSAPSFFGRYDRVYLVPKN